MPTVWDKLDDGFSSVYSKFLRGSGGGKLHVLIRYEGDPQKLAAAGFEMVWNDGDSRATGALRMEDVERVAALPEVIRIYYSRPHVPSLNRSIPDIRANQVWTLASGLDPGERVFSGTTGNGVLIGIIDTGIDFTHEFFMSSLSPKTTRILRIWDQGLIPVAGETSPRNTLANPVLHLAPPATYGVEYTNTQINAYLRPPPGALRIRHRDCSGHGTHVASIAAGNGRNGFTYIGVAPKAELVIVKLLDPEDPPQVAGAPVSFDQRFMDAVRYIRAVAASQSPSKPVVINYSAGSPMGPHDGLTDQEDWLGNEFRPAASAGKIFVAAAGNSGGNRQHGFIEFAAAGTLEIPFQLYDNRGGNTTDFGTCVPRDNTQELFLNFYYPRGGAIISVAFQPLGASALVPSGADAFTAGPGLGGGPVSLTFAGCKYTLRHSNHDDPQTGGGPIVERNLIVLQADPHPLIGHALGTHLVRLDATGPVKVHVWCDQATRHGWRLGSALPAGVIAQERYLIGSPGGARNIVTVAAFDAESAGAPVARFSSRGPLVRYGAAGGIPPAKPELGAPGVSIDAAKSKDVPLFLPGTTASRDGTSQAAPHVTGAIALMLEKNPTLTSADVISILQAYVRMVPARATDEIGAGRLDVKDAVDKTPR